MPKFLIPFLSLLCPGLSHYFLGKKKKAFCMMSVFLIMILLFVFSDQWMMKFIAVLTYVLLAIPAMVESAMKVFIGKEDVLSDSKLYTSVLLLMTGMAALPMLWQNDTFDRRGKIIWTITVILLAVIFFFFLGEYMDVIEKKVKEMINA